MSYIILIGNLPNKTHSECAASICTAGHLTNNILTRPHTISAMDTPIHSAISHSSDLHMALPTKKFIQTVKKFILYNYAKSLYK